MIVHDLEQGTPDWLAYRLTHDNASDAPAMLGCSPYKSRGDLLHERHTGLTPLVEPATQRRYDEGHRIEALARVLAEEIIGEDLYPVTASNGRLSASFDGLSMDEAIVFEHKTLNDELRACMKQDDDGDLPLLYQVQLEQQLMVSGATSALFMASKWQGDKLLEERHCWYLPQPELAARITAGWKQFRADLAAYEPPAVLPVVVAAPVDGLPAVLVRVNGELTVASNLPEFAAALRAFIGKIPVKPTTDQEFADTESACKALKKAEDALDAAESRALAMPDIEEMRRMMAELRNLARMTRLASEKQVATQKESIRFSIVRRAQLSLTNHITALNARLGRELMPAITADWASAIKGKRTIESLTDAVGTLLANTKIEASAVADRISLNLITLCELAADHAFLFPDSAQIVLKAPDDLTAFVQSRIAIHERQAREKKTRAQTATAAAAITKAQTAPAPVQQRQSTSAELPELRLGQICQRLGFGVTAEFLRALGIEPAGRDRMAILYWDADYPRICDALIAHIKHARQLLTA